jgi:3-deoxy-D-manno-octulosonic-acid transferase
LQVLRGRASWVELRQRLGRSRPPQCWKEKTGKKRKRLLIHAVSVGEVAAAEVILERLWEEAPDIDVVFTTGNRDGKKAAETMRQHRPQIKEVSFLPWDRKRALQLWLSRWKPDLVVVVETEIWPNLFYACRKLKIPLYIVNGRVYWYDVARYRKAKFFFRCVLSCAEWIGVQNLREKERFLKIGAHREQLQVVGNVKFDRSPRCPPQSSRWGERLGNRGLIIVAGSTHFPEERLLLSCLEPLRAAFPRLRLVLVPRRVSRCASLERLVRRFGFRAVRWSGPGNDTDWDVLLVDQIGWLAYAYKHADLAVVGGSFCSRGGHNLLEAAAHERAIIIGPHVEHFREIVEDFNRAGALRWLQSGSELHANLHQLLSDEPARRAMGQKAHLLMESAKGGSWIYARALHERLGVSR